jgi:putative ribosome biogenesis GTPase RsgA
MKYPDSLMRARVCAAAQEYYSLRFEDGSAGEAAPSGALRWSAELPAVGDWVWARWADSTLALIESLEPRRTCISRQRSGGGEQVLAAMVALNKMEVCEACPARLAEVQALTRDVLALSAHEPDSRGRHTTRQRMLIELPGGCARSRRTRTGAVGQLPEAASRGPVSRALGGSACGYGSKAKMESDP